MFATAIIGSTVGVKYAMRTRARAGSRSFTQIAISMASAIEVGMVPSAKPEVVAQHLPEDRVVGERGVVAQGHEPGRPHHRPGREQAVEERRRRRVVGETDEQDRGRA